MMQLYVCGTCGFFRDVTAMSFLAGFPAKVGQYNKTVTHCPNGHGLMRQVQEGDRLAVIEQKDKEEKKACGEYIYKDCGQCHDPGCYEYQECKEKE